MRRPGQQHEAVLRVLSSHGLQVPQVLRFTFAHRWRRSIWTASRFCAFQCIFNVHKALLVPPPSDHTGEVIAEAKDAELEPFLGLRYPVCVAKHGRGRRWL